MTQTQTLYVATADNSSMLVGVFETLETAKAAFPPVVWEEDQIGEIWSAQLPERGSPAFTADPRYAWWRDRTEDFYIVRVDVGSVLICPPEAP